MPTTVKPMLAHLVDRPFSRKGWIFEIKWDGYRILAYVTNKKVKLVSRNQKDYTGNFSEVAQELSQLGLNAIFDGEMVVVDKKGYAQFQWLQQFQKTGKGQLIYYIFDLLWLNGQDLRSRPLQQRKELLTQVLHKSDHVQMSDYIEEVGKKFFNIAAKKGLEGIMAKDASSSYQSGKRSQSWLKMKVKQSQEAIICGYTAPRGSRSHIGALILGIYQKNRLTYIGHTAGKLTQQNLADLKQQLDRLAQPKSPFAKPPKTNAPVTWVKPILVAEITFAEWTDKGQLRQPIFIGLRQDKPAKIVSQEKPINVSSHEENNLEEKIVTIDKHKLKLTHLEKVYWPEEGYTKGDLIDYYRSISEIILPYLKDRPESLNRHPNGIHETSFFQKNIKSAPDWVKTKIVHSSHKSNATRYLLCQNEATLIYMANLGCIELNPWLSRITAADRPDFCVLDLDSEDIGFEAVVKTAQAIHHLLKQIDIDSYCKTSGKTGLHIYIPFGGKYNYNQSKNFAELIATIISNKLPDMTSIVRSPGQRQGKVYIDFLQNRPKQTVAAPYSVRPVAEAPVSTPLRWSEVTKRLNPTKFTMKTTPNRIEKLGDIWEKILHSSINLELAIKKLGSLHADT